MNTYKRHRFRLGAPPPDIIASISSINATFETNVVQTKDCRQPPIAELYIRLRFKNAPGRLKDPTEAHKVSWGKRPAGSDPETEPLSDAAFTTHVKIGVS